jgi:hypothetical protein
MLERLQSSDSCGGFGETLNLEQRKDLCDLIDVFDGEFVNQFHGHGMTKQQSKNYIINYGNE